MNTCKIENNEQILAVYAYYIVLIMLQTADMDGMNKSAQTVNKLIQGEMRAGIPSNRIIIGGFSQGKG